MDAVEYGLRCSRDTEKNIVKSVNAYLRTKDYRKMYKWKDKGGIKNIDDPSSDPQLEYSYVQFIKESPRWYLDISPNVDLRGIHRFPKHPDCAWTLYFSMINPESNSESDTVYLNNFLSELLVGTGCDNILLHQYTDSDYRR